MAPVAFKLSLFMQIQLNFQSPPEIQEPLCTSGEVAA